MGSIILVVGAPGMGKSTLLRYLVRSQLIKDEDNEQSFFRLRNIHSRLPLLVSLHGISSQKGDFQTKFREQIQSDLGMRLKDKLPTDFFFDWQQQSGVDWLLLLDGLDEIVSEEQRISIVAELNNNQWLGNLKIILTSRPTSLNLAPQLNYKSLFLLPFGLEQIREFSQLWFSGDSLTAKQFEEEVASLRFGPLKGTPLALTISAKVFKEHNNTLSGISRAGLYESYFKTIFKEEDSPSKLLRKQICELIGSAYGDRIFILRKEVVEEIAYALHKELPLNECISKYLIDKQIDISTNDVERCAEKIFTLISRSTFLFNNQVGDFNFEHLTFREYLCAFAIVRKAGNDAQKIWDNAVSKWSEAQWKEVSLFILGILSSREQTKKIAGVLVRQIFGLGDMAFFFVIECMADQVFVEEDIREAVFSELDRRVSEARIENGPIKLNNIYEAIIDSIQDQRVAEAVKNIALDSQFARDSRIEAARTLSSHRFRLLAAAVWVRLLKDQEQAAIWFHTFIAHNMNEYTSEISNPNPPPWWRDGVDALREDQSSHALLELAIDGNCPITVRLDCANALEEMGQKELAGEAWLLLAQDNSINIWWRNEAMRRLARQGI